MTFVHWEKFEDCCNQKMHFFLKHEGNEEKKNTSINKQYINSLK